MLGRQWVSLCKTTAGVSLSMSPPHQQLAHSTEKKKSQIFYSSHTFWQQQNEWMFQPQERGICCMQIDFQIAFTLELNQHLTAVRHYIYSPEAHQGDYCLHFTECKAE